MCRGLGCVYATLNEGIRDSPTEEVTSGQDLEKPRERCKHKGPRQEGRGGSEERLGAVSPGSREDEPEGRGWEGSTQAWQCAAGREVGGAALLLCWEKLLGLAWEEGPPGSSCGCPSEGGWWPGRASSRGREKSGLRQGEDKASRTSQRMRGDV